MALIEGAFPFGVEVVTSIRNDTRLVVEAGAFDRDYDPDVSDVFLLLGYDYNRAIASTQSGLLTIELSAEKMEFRTSRQAAGSRAPTVAGKAAADLIKSRLTGGVIPGFRPIQSRDEELPGGGRRTVVQRGMLCEVNLVSRVTPIANLTVR